MKNLMQMRIFLFSILFSIDMIVFFIFSGNLERISIVFGTILVYRAIVSMKKRSWREIWIVIIGILIGWFLSFLGLCQLGYEDISMDASSQISNTSDTAVLLIYTGEPSRYDIPIYLKNIFEKKHIGKKLYLPYELYKKKRAYEYIGSSRFEEMTSNISRQLTSLMDNHYDIFISYTNDKPYYHQVINQILLKENYKKIIISPVNLMQSTDYIRAINQLGIHNLYRSKAIIKCTMPLWDSEKIPKAIANKVNILNKDDKKSDVGVILVNESINSIKVTEIKPQNMNYNVLFMEKVKGFLISKGFEYRKIKYIEWAPKEEEIRDRIKQLQEYGVAKIFIISIGDLQSPIDRKHSMIKLIEEIEGVEIQYIDGWGEEAALIEELESRIRLLNVEP